MPQTQPNHVCLLIRATAFVATHSTPRKQYELSDQHLYVTSCLLHCWLMRHLPSKTPKIHGNISRKYVVRQERMSFQHLTQACSYLATQGGSLRKEGECLKSPQTSPSVRSAQPKCPHQPSLQCLFLPVTQSTGGCRMQGMLEEKEGV